MWSYQPVVSAKSGNVAGAEVVRLVRSTQTDEGRLLPTVGGDCTATEPLEPTGSALDSLIGDLLLWDEVRRYRLKLYLKVSAHLFDDAQFESELMNKLQQRDLSPYQFVFVMEHAAIVQMAPSATQRLLRLRRQGVMVALEALGSLHLGVEDISALTVDAFRIGRELIQAAISSPVQAAVCRTIAELARGLGVRIVAEGISTDAELAFARQLGCVEFQGPFIAATCAAGELFDLLRSEQVSCNLKDRSVTGARHLLLVDDEPNVLRSLQRTLRAVDMTIHAVTRPDEAFDALARFPIGVVLSDQRMPEMTGSEFLRRVKELHPATQRIVLSGYTELQSITDAINRGAISKFLTKPWNDSELRSALETAFQDFEVLAENRRLQAELAAANLQLEETLRQQSRRLHKGENVLHALQEAMSALPVPVLGVGVLGELVLINDAAGLLFAEAEPLLGEPVHPWIGIDVLSCVSANAPSVSSMPGFSVHCQPIGGVEDCRGVMVTLIPESA